MVTFDQNEKPENKLLTRKSTHSENKQPFISKYFYFFLDGEPTEDVIKFSLPIIGTQVSLLSYHVMPLLVF